MKLNFKEGEKVKVSPVGEVIGLDGRGFTIDGKSLIADIMANELDIPLDANHDFDKALGWFAYDSFELRDDGIYALLEFTPEGEEANTNKSYKYLSPVYVMRNDRVVAGLDSVGFVNRPNLLNNALNTKGDEKTMTIEELKTQLDEAKASIADAVEKMGSIGASIEAIEANSKKQDENIETLKTQIVEMNKKVAIFAKQSNLDPNNNGGDLSESELRTAKLLGLSADEYKTAKGGK